MRPPCLDRPDGSASAQGINNPLILDRGTQAENQRDRSSALIPPMILLAVGVVLDALAMLGVPWLMAEGPLSESTRRW